RCFAQFRDLTFEISIPLLGVLPLLALSRDTGLKPLRLLIGCRRRILFIALGFEPAAFVPLRPAGCSFLLLRLFGSLRLLRGLSGLHRRFFAVEKVLQIVHDYPSAPVMLGVSVV